MHLVMKHGDRHLFKDIIGMSGSGSDSSIYLWTVQSYQAVNGFVSFKKLSTLEFNLLPMS